MRLGWRLTAVLLFITSGAQIALGQSYPAKPIRLIIPFAPGGTDILGRMIAGSLSQTFGQTVIVDNRPGAGGAIGAEIAAHAPADGYTLCMTTSSYAASAAFRKTSYDPINGVEPVILVGTMGLVMVTHPSVPVKNIKEFIDYAKASPGKISYGSVGAGSINHLAIESFKLATGTNLVHIPYKGAGPALVAAVSGEIQLAPFGLVATLPHVKAGRLRAIAITTPTRSPVLPDVPSVSEAVPGFEVIHWAGIWAPNGTPKAIVQQWNREVAKVLHGGGIRAKMTAGGLQPAGGPPEEFGHIIRTHIERWRQVVKQAKIDLAH